MEVDKIKELFKDHVLTEVLNTPELKVFDFRVGNTMNLYQRWIIDRGTLIVQYDCWDAIYRWNNSSISLAFLAKCNVHYFSEKCLADKDGCNQTEYNAEHAEELMKEIACDNIFHANYENLEDISDEQWKLLELDEKLNLVIPILLQESQDFDEWDLKNGFFYHEFESDAVNFMMQTEHEIMFGCDAWEYSLTRLTQIPYLHLGALRMAQEKYPNTF